MPETGLYSPNFVMSCTILSSNVISSALEVTKPSSTQFQDVSGIDDPGLILILAAVRNQGGPNYDYAVACLEG